MSRAVLALDIGGTKLAAGVVDRSGLVHSFLVEPSLADEGPDRVLARLFELGRRAVAESGVEWEDVEGVGIGCGGPLDAERGVLLAPPHLPGWHDVAVTALAEDAYERPAVLENDATAAALGEHRFGAGAGTLNMVYLTISTGVGGGVVVGGRLYRGSGGNGAELGHVTVDWHGRPCRGCGRAGCLEAYASGTSISERMREALALADGGAASLNGVTATDVAALARDGHPIATAVWNETVAALACGLTSIVNLFEPDLVVIGGGVSRAGEQLLGPVRQWVRANAIAPGGRAADIVEAALGDHVGVVGAAAIAHDRIEEQRVATRG
ncbi:MAG TPA: ROK family protein [Gaiellaceae bacterium]|nr:ROK family protein [Gaiellaceae bacterium]